MITDLCSNKCSNSYLACEPTHERQLASRSPYRACRKRKSPSASLTRYVAFATGARSSVVMNSDSAKKPKETTIGIQLMRPAMNTKDVSSVTNVAPKDVVPVNDPNTSVVAC